MHSMLQKYVTDGFMTEAQGQFIEDAIEKKQSVIIAGHRSSGSRPFMAAVMGVAKSKFSSAQVKDAEGLEKDVEYFLIPAAEGHEKLIENAIRKTGKAFVTLKEPENPLSIKKVVKTVWKENKDTSQTYVMVECRKEDGVPYVDNISTTTVSEDGKINTENIQF